VVLGISADGAALELTGTGPLSVAEVDEGQTANTLGLRGTSTAGVLTGRDVRPPLTASTSLTAIEALAGELPLGSVEVTVGGVTTTVDFSSALTVGSLQTILASAVPGLQIQIQPNRLDVVAGGSEIFTVVGVAGDNTASLLGIEGTGTPVRLFGMLEDLKVALQSGDSFRIRSTLTELAAMEQTVHGEMIRTGGRQRDLDWVDGILRQRDERLRASLSLERDADVAQVTTELSRAETIYQASLLVTSKLFDSNLMMYLR
jgi:flagellin-like hook-associated protein FlgL